MRRSGGAGSAGRRRRPANRRPDPVRVGFWPGSCNFLRFSSARRPKDSDPLASTSSGWMRTPSSSWNQSIWSAAQSGRHVIRRDGKTGDDGPVERPAGRIDRHQVAVDQSVLQVLGRRRPGQGESSAGDGRGAQLDRRPFRRFFARRHYKSDAGLT